MMRKIDGHWVRPGATASEQNINEHMHLEDINDAEARIAYLEVKLGETNIAGMQQVFYQPIESETRTVMLGVFMVFVRAFIRKG